MNARLNFKFLLAALIAWAIGVSTLTAQEAGKKTETATFKFCYDREGARYYPQKGGHEPSEYANDLHINFKNQAEVVVPEDGKIDGKWGSFSKGYKTMHHFPPHDGDRNAQHYGEAGRINDKECIEIQFRGDTMPTIDSWDWTRDGHPIAKYNFEKGKYEEWPEPELLSHIPHQVPSSSSRTLNYAAGLLISAVGTGETTGEIGLLTLTNPTRQPIRFSPGAVFIPSDEAQKTQPYIVPPPPPVLVPSGSTIELPINGYCAAVHLPPVGSGQPMPPVEDWVTAQPLPSGWTPNPQDGWTPSATATVLNPVTGQPLEHTLDFGQHPEAAADLLLAAIEQIGRAYDDLQGQGSISTPFSGRPEQEREAVVQQTFWIFAAGVQGEDYGQEDFEGKAIKQFEHSTGQNFNAAPAPVQASVKDGIMDFWNTFQAVGAKAKVFNAKAADITENWGPVIERKYELYAVHRQTGHSHDSAMRRVFPSEEMRELYGDAFRKRYEQ